MTNVLIKDLNKIINQNSIMTVFQPIISLRDGSILGYEALSRVICDSNFRNIADLFNFANANSRLWDLESLCRVTALESAYNFLRFPHNYKLFLNVDPNIIKDSSFKEGFTKDFLLRYDVKPKNIIFEITERNSIKDFDNFIRAIEHYKSQGYKIAIDDAGTGYSSLNLISEIKPHYIKINMNLIRGISSNKVKAAIVKGMVEVSNSSGIQLIAEGIETYDELETVSKLGVQYGQGFLIQKPSESIIDIDRSLLNELGRIVKRNNKIKNFSIPEVKVKHISNPNYILSPNQKVSLVYNMLKSQDNFHGFCVVDNGEPLGIIVPEKLSLKLSGQYGFTLYYNKEITKIMDRDFLKVDINLSVNEVANLAMSRNKDKLYDLVVVTEDNKFYGTLTVRDLLLKSSELEVKSATHKNPLTGLPGNLIIEQELVKCFSEPQNRTIAYIDIDNFKAFNDYYGFERGDSVIALLARILKGRFDDQFIGHIGGDDLLIVFDKVIQKEIFEAVVKDFEVRVLEHYDKADIERGYTCVLNRSGQKVKFPLSTITYVCIDNKSCDFVNTYELTRLLADQKKRVRAKKASCCY